LKRWLSAEVRAELAAEFIQDLDLPEYRRRTRAPVAGVTAHREVVETSDNAFSGTIGIEGTVQLAHAWNTGESPGDSELLETWFGNIREQIDEIGGRAAHVEQREGRGTLRPLLHPPLILRLDFCLWGRVFGIRSGFVMDQQQKDTV
jgi:hypothetical protein